MIRLLILTTVANIVRIHTPAAAMSLEAVDFEVFGTVQGVFFRKNNKVTKLKRNLNMGALCTKHKCPPGHVLVSVEAPIDTFDFEVLFFKRDKINFLKYTKEQADKLGVRGWCKNTRQGTVVGHMQGPPQKVHQMVIWLRSTGSPNSIIDRVIYRNGSEIAEYTFEGFEIRKS